MSLSLYKTTELAQLHNHVDEETGEINMEAWLAIKEIALPAKQRAVVAYLKNDIAMIGMLENAIKELQERLKTSKQRNAYIKESLLQSMKESNTLEVEALDKTFGAKLYLDRDESVVIDENALFPLELCNKPKPPEPSKTLIKEAILRGEAVAGAYIVRKDRLTIN